MNHECCIAIHYSRPVVGRHAGGFFATHPNILSRYDAATSARVRVYVYTADRIRLDFNRTCFLPASGLFGHGDGPETIQRSHMRGSGSVGIPPSPDITGQVFDLYRRVPIVNSIKLASRAVMLRNIAGANATISSPAA